VSEGAEASFLPHDGASAGDLKVINCHDTGASTEESWPDMNTPHAALHAGALAALLLAAAAPAIDPPTGAVRTRMLIGTSSEGTEVDAVMQHGQVRRIVAEALNETGRTMSDFHFDHGSLVRARIIRVGYKGYPYANMPAVPPHKHLVIDPTDTVLDDNTYDFSATHATPCTKDAECARGQKEAQQAAATYVRLMNTPSPGMAEDEGDWQCVPGGNAGCTGFRHETP